MKTEMEGIAAENVGALQDLDENVACGSIVSSSSSESMAATGNCCSSEEASSSSSFYSNSTPQSTISDAPHLGDGHIKQEWQGSALPASLAEIEMMKERFGKLLLGEDMSGCGNGVSTALAISNAVTNLSATVFGQLWRLEPLAIEKKRMWRREMEWILSVTDHIVEMIPTWQTFPNGTKLEIMTCRPRSDLHVNLPALRKLDNMLLEALDSFRDTMFWYVDQGIVVSESTDGSCSFRRQLQRQEEKWWLPVPHVPSEGLDEDTRMKLQHKRECINQIFKAAMAINTITLVDMDVPHSFMDTLPKNGRACLGDLVYRYITSEKFSAECLLDCLDLSSEHEAIEIANRVEASIYLWRQTRPSNGGRRSAPRSPWGVVKELVMDVDKRDVFADRAESLLLCLKRRFPSMPQTTLDMTKIQCNKDVGKSILESYSRVLESLAFNIMARIDDVLYVDDLTKHLDQFSPISRASVISHKTVSIPYSSSATPFKTPLPIQRFSPPKGERSLFLSSSSKLLNREASLQKVLTDYLNISTARLKEYGSPNYSGTSAKAQVNQSEYILSTTQEFSVTSSEIRSAEPLKKCAIEIFNEPS